MELNVTLETALGQLDKNNDNHWTADGLPKVETLKFITGNQGLTREAINAEFPNFRRNSEIATPVVESPQVFVAETPVPAVTEQAEPEVAEAETLSAGEYTLEEKLSFAEEELEVARSDAEEAQAHVVKMEAYIAELQQQIVDRDGVETSQTAIQRYLQSQQLQQEERSKRIKLIADSGIKLKDLAEGLKAPIDSSFNRKRKR